MKKPPIPLFLAISLLIVTSCAPIIGLEVTNNTGGAIIVSSIDLHGKETRYQLNQGQTIGIAVGYTVRIQQKGGTWDYSFPKLPPSRYLRHVKRNIYVETLQIEKGGLIYERSPDASPGPTSEFPPQPPGYPIAPNAK